MELPLVATLFAVALLAATLAAASGCRHPAPDKGAATDGSGSGQSVTAYGGVDFVLDVVTTVPGAEISFNGASLGASPVRGVQAKGHDQNRITIRAGVTEWERIITPRQSLFPNRCVYLDATLEDPVQDFQPRVIRSEPDGALVYLDGVEVGKTPLSLDLIADRTLYMVVWAEGYLPERYLLEPPSYPGATADRFVVLDASAGGAAGPVEATQGPSLPPIAWDGPSSGLVRPGPKSTPYSRLSLSPSGQLALITGAGPVESVGVYDLSARQEAGSALVSWRSAEMVVDRSNHHFFLDLCLVDWRDEELLFLAPEPQPGGTPGQIGLGLWAAGVGGPAPERVAWIPEWGLGRLFETAWLTTDGQAAVVQTVETGPGAGSHVCHFHVVDLDTGEQAVYSGELPCYESALYTFASRSPDGWQLAYDAGQVKRLDLRTGEEHVLYDGPGGGDGSLRALSWSPDGHHLAIAAGEDGGEAFVLGGDDISHFFPGSFQVVAADGTRVAEVAIPGSALYHALEWDPTGTRVAVRTVQRGESSRDILLGPVYAGPLAGPWTEVDDGGSYPAAWNGDWSSWFGFAPDGRLVVAATDPDGAAETVLIDLNGRQTAVTAHGYAPLAELPQGVLLATTQTSPAGLAPMALLKLAGSLVPLNASSSFHSCQWPFVLLRGVDWSIRILVLDGSEGL